MRILPSNEYFSLHVCLHNRFVSLDLRLLLRLGELGDRVFLVRECETPICVLARPAYTVSQIASRVAVSPLPNTFDTHENLIRPRLDRRAEPRNPARQAQDPRLREDLRGEEERRYPR